MPTTPLLDLVVDSTREPDLQIDSIRRSIKYTRARIISSREHLKDSRDALQRADEQIGRLAPAKVR